MENGTFMIKTKDGQEYRGRLGAVRFEPNKTNPDYFACHFVELDYSVGITPAPFRYIDSDGKEYDVYTMFHPQLKDMIGTEGYFYDVVTRAGIRGKLNGVSGNGCPTGAGAVSAYFAVPIEKPKTKLTMDEIAEKFGIPVDELVISKGDNREGNNEII